MTKHDFILNIVRLFVLSEKEEFKDIAPSIMLACIKANRNLSAKQMAKWLNDCADVYAKLDR